MSLAWPCSSWLTDTRQARLVHPTNRALKRSHVCPRYDPYRLKDCAMPQQTTVRVGSSSTSCTEYARHQFVWQWSWCKYDRQRCRLRSHLQLRVWSRNTNRHANSYVWTPSVNTGSNVKNRTWWSSTSDDVPCSIYRRRRIPGTWINAWWSCIVDGESCSCYISFDIVSENRCYQLWYCFGSFF
jgi:hypothetical protein